MVADLAAEAASAVKPQYLAILDLRGVSSFTDHFLIASADSARQVRAIAERVEEHLDPGGRAHAASRGHWRGALDFA